MRGAAARAVPTAHDGDRYVLRTMVKNLRNSSDFALALDWGFHSKNRWVSAYAPFLVNELVRRFDPLIISSQLEYDLHKKRIRRLISFEPGFASPRLSYDRRQECVKCVIYSDPHHQPEARRRYFDENGFDFVLSFYQAPFFQHFPGFPEEKFVHFPWAVPDRFIAAGEIRARSNEVAIFGGKGGDAYDVRNWCREQPFVTGFEYSGVENKQLSDEGYYRWLAGFDAIVAAGSSRPDYNMVTPKYFEIAASGALLIGQYCEDLETLGFNDGNALIFTKGDFVDQVQRYRRDPEAYLAIRQRGRELIRHRHKLSDRLESVRTLLGLAAAQRRQAS